MNISSLSFLIRECFKGKSFSRSLHNLYLTKLDPFSGKGIDFGAKNASSSYYRFIEVDYAEMTYTDLFSKNTSKVVSIDFEQDFDLSSNCFDFALCMNTLEHVFNHRNFLINISNSKIL